MFFHHNRKSLLYIYHQESTFLLTRFSELQLRYPHRDVRLKFLPQWPLRAQAAAQYVLCYWGVNDKLIKIRGANRHQSYPYVGYAMPKRAQYEDAELIKELGFNAVRTSHYPQSPDFLDKCDELGLLVFEEIPGWQNVGDESWQAIAVENVKDMIIRDKNHPSIILWGVRINESGDYHDFYTKTNEIAHELDPYRQTGGVRCFPHSELLEDVYTYNDFVNTGGDTYLRNKCDVTASSKPYLVTEYGGHMFPTKSFDNETRRTPTLLPG